MTSNEKNIGRYITSWYWVLWDKHIKWISWELMEYYDTNRNPISRALLVLPEKLIYLHKRYCSLLAQNRFPAHGVINIYSYFWHGIIVLRYPINWPLLKRIILIQSFFVFVLLLLFVLLCFVLFCFLFFCFFLLFLFFCFLFVCVFCGSFRGYLYYLHSINTILNWLTKIITILPCYNYPAISND